MKKKIRERITEALDMPKDLALNLPKISILGDKEMLIENYKSIIEYNDNAVRLKTSGKIIKVTGAQLQIRTITDEDMMIEGKITSIEFMS